DVCSSDLLWSAIPASDSISESVKASNIFMDDKYSASNNLSSFKIPAPNININQRNNLPSGNNPLSRLKIDIVLKNHIKNKNRPAMNSSQPSTQSTAHAAHW